MCNIYVTNKTVFTAYIRLRSTVTDHELASTFVKEVEEIRTPRWCPPTKNLFHTLLVQGGFHPILPKTTMYSIYVTDKTRSGETVYVRLESTKMATGFIKAFEELKDDDLIPRERKQRLTALLVRAGFHAVLSKKTVDFPVLDLSACMYASLVSESKLTVVDFQVHPKMYGCIAIKCFWQDALLSDVFVPSNPKPVWISANSGDALPQDIIEAGNSPTEGTKFYFGRSHVSSFLPCNVTSKVGRCESWSGNNKGDFLKNTGYELVRVKRDDPIPPHAVMTGLTEPGGSLYVGRVGGNIPCSIITNQQNGLIYSFSYSGGNAANGEILVLTNDPDN